MRVNELEILIDLLKRKKNEMCEMVSKCVRKLDQYGRRSS